jgi:hypothetical protein
MSEIRASVVGLLLAGCAGEIDQDAYEATLSESTDDEREAVARICARAARELTAPERPPSLLSLDLNGLTDASGSLLAQGVALAWLRDQFVPLWAARPSASLGDIAKILPAERLAYIGAELAKVGLSLDDELTPPRT